MIDVRNSFNQPVIKIIKNAYDKILKITSGKGDDYRGVCLLDDQLFVC